MTSEFNHQPLIQITIGTICYKVQRSRANEITTPHTVKHEAEFEDTLVLVDELDVIDFEDECDANGISYE